MYGVGIITVYFLALLVLPISVIVTNGNQNIKYLTGFRLKVVAYEVFACVCV